MMAWYPVSLDLEGRPCVVIGGGPVAEQKVIGLLEAGACVTVVSSEWTRGLDKLAAEGSIHLARRAYRTGDLAGAFLAIAAADDRAVNGAVWEEAGRRGVLLNAVDDIAHCHFIAPAIHRQGDLAVAVSTGGKSPALAVRVRDAIGALIGPEYGVFLDLLGEFRPEIASRVRDAAMRAAAWRRIVDSDAIEFLRRGDLAGARDRIARLLLEDAQQEAAPAPHAGAGT